MRALFVTLESPAENIALDETLLLLAEWGDGEETLRIWESSRPFVAVGLNGRISEEVILDFCSENNIPPVRRASGGGSVLQGPGCLNYSVVLSMNSLSELRGIRSSFNHVLSRIAFALTKAGAPVQLSGLTDLSASGRKVSGNAQLRKRNCFLQHGTLLYDFDIGSMEKCLKYPRRTPAYRLGRAHSNFVSNLPLTRAALFKTLCRAFEVNHDLPRHSLCSRELTLVHELVSNKYGLESWTFRR